MDTKMMMNSKFKANKRSCIERFALFCLVFFAFFFQRQVEVDDRFDSPRKLNYFVAVFAIFLVLISILCLVGSISYERLYASHWYLFGREPNSFYVNMNVYFAYN